LWRRDAHLLQGRKGRARGDGKMMNDDEASTADEKAAPEIAARLPALRSQ
jgi:hypothetical protein